MILRSVKWRNRNSVAPLQHLVNVLNKSSWGYMNMIYSIIIKCSVLDYSYNNTKFRMTPMYFSSLFGSFAFLVFYSYTSIMAVYITCFASGETTSNYQSSSLRTTLYKVNLSNKKSQVPVDILNNNSLFCNKPSNIFSSNNRL